MLIQEIEPCLRFDKVQRSVPGGLARTPLGDKEGSTVLERSAGLFSQVTLVSAGVEVERVRDVLTFELVFGGPVHVLRPGGCATNDKIIGVLSDRCQDFLVVRFQMLAPVDLKRLVEGLKEHVRQVAVDLSHLCKEGLGLLSVIEGRMIMPVNDHVDSFPSRSFNDLHELSLFLLTVLQVASGFNTHRCTQQAYLPIGPQPVNDVLIPIGLAPLRPEKGHAAKLHGITMFA
mmetsp:Transcript_30605/g.55474  ORF Transcript_30605/g.55474 Transcript_30605/m.55474 type:complete len:231 (+) Transcript_30605:321-1013(+)